MPLTLMETSRRFLLEYFLPLFLLIFTSLTFSCSSEHSLRHLVENLDLCTPHNIFSPTTRFLLVDHSVLLATTFQLLLSFLTKIMLLLHKILSLKTYVMHSCGILCTPCTYKFSLYLLRLRVKKNYVNALLMGTMHSLHSLVEEKQLKLIHFP
jgi:hypothetical protein